MEKVAVSSSPLPSMSNGINKDASNTQSTSTISSVSISSISNTNQVGAGEASANVPFPSTASIVSNQQSSSPQSCQSACQNVVKGNLQTEGDKLIDSNFSTIKVESVAVPSSGESEQRKEASSLVDGTSKKISVIDELPSSLVPNFHVEGSGLGDSSITVAVASLNSAVPLSSSVVVPHESQGGPPGSGPASVQSSEEMKLSLVSWYSEPDDPSRVISDSVSISCCAQSTSLHLHNGRQTVSMTNSVMSKSGSEEKENRTPEPAELCTNASTDKQAVIENDSKSDSNTVGGHSQRVKMHVQLLEQKCSSHSENGGNNLGCSVKKDSNESCQSTKDFKSIKPDCPRCSRRSKSGSTTPSNNLHCHPQPRSRIPANRRVIPSTKSSTELKKPIKSILKRESRGSGGSGSGSDNKSSMDSLGSSAELGNTPLRSIMTRSDSGSRAKFNLNHQIFDDSSSPSEDRFNSKLRRIEKYATLRMRKPNKVKPLEFSDTDVNSCTSGGEQSSCCSKAGTPSELMSKSMSFLEKSTVTRVERAPLSSNSSLKRQGSLRVKRSPPVWEPCTTRTTALRMQKLHESKAKSGGGHYTSPNSSNTNGHHHSGSAHSGSGESIHHLNHSTSSLHHHSTGGRSGGGSSSGMSAKGHSHHSQVSVKDSKCGSTTKVFAKLSSAMGQTASSNQKRLKQEKYIQTEETPQQNFCSRCHHINGDGASSISPIPTVEGALDLAEQIKRLEGLANRYRNTALRYQSEYEKSEAKKTELTKQLVEAQTESSEMIDFLQAEKSTLAESLTEIENEAKKSRDEIDLIKKDAQSRCSSLVRLCEQHKQETLRYQALLTRLEAQSRSTTAQMASDMSDGISSIATMKEKVCQLTHELLKAYKIPESLLSLPMDAANSIPNASVNTNLRSSLLLPLISSLAIAFPLSKLEPPDNTSTGNIYPCQGLQDSLDQVVKMNQESKDRPSQTTSFTGHMKESSSLQSLNQAILDREAAENTTGLDAIDLTKPEEYFGFGDGSHSQLKPEIYNLNVAISKLFQVIRVIIMQCDNRVSEVTSNILQCLQSIEEDKKSIPDMLQVQKSLESCKDP